MKTCKDCVHYNVCHAVEIAGILQNAYGCKSFKDKSRENYTTVFYHPINEAAARRAKEANSFSDYKPGSATAEYRQYVDEAAELAARQKKRVALTYHAETNRPS